MNHDAFAHARDELGISATGTARPIQAALTSAATLSPLALCCRLSDCHTAPHANLIVLVSAASLLFLALLGISSGLYRWSQSIQGRSGTFCATWLRV